MDIKSGTFRHFLRQPAIDNSQNPIGPITIDNQQNVWSGLNGINKLDTRTWLSKKYLENLIAYGNIQDKEGAVWCGTTAGLYLFDKEKDAFSSVTDESGLINSSLGVGVLMEDRQQNLWAATTKGIVRFDKERKYGVMYARNQGVTAGLLTFNAFLRSNGDLLYTDSSGYYEIKSDFIKRQPLVPAVAITGFRLNDSLLQPSPAGILTSSLSTTRRLRLTHRQNTFSIAFTNIDFVSDPGDSRLRYRLENYDKVWRSSGDDKSASYFNVQPGTYVFRIRAFSALGGIAERQIEITISPPWWKNWWAYTVLFSAVAGIVYAIYRHRINQLKAKQAFQMNLMIAAQEGERQRIASDLHDDVGTKLSALKMSLSSLHDEANAVENEKIKMLTSNAEQFIADVIQDVRQLLLNLSPTVLEDFGYTTAVEGLVNKINETKQIQFSLVIFGFKKTLKKDYELALYRITQELINNVLKHSEAKTVSLQIGQRDGKIILMIEDDGKGFSVSNTKDGYGLHNLEARTRIMRGTMAIDSQIGKGTSVLIEIPYNDI
jgi:signal transduction histidine kinase